MLYVFKAGPALFQTAWFIESLFTQTLVIFAIRTRAIPFFKSKPSKILVLNVVIVLAIAITIPYIALGKVFGFVSLPATFIFILIGFIVVYLFLIELMKIWFYRHFGGIPRKRVRFVGASIWGCHGRTQGSAPTVLIANESAMAITLYPHSDSVGLKPEVCGSFPRVRVAKIWRCPRKSHSLQFWQSE